MILHRKSLISKCRGEYWWGWGWEELWIYVSTTNKTLKKLSGLWIREQSERMRQTNEVSLL